MPKVTHAAKVGLFLVVCAAALTLVLRMIDKGGGGGGAYVVHAYLKDATGLAVHSRVTIAGIPVGTIDTVSLENNHARFDIRIHKDVVLYDNATIGKKSALVLGESMLVLTAGTEDHRRLQNGDEITHVIEFTETADVLDEVKQIADKVRLVAEQLANAIGSERGGQNMSAILENLANATEAMNTTIRENREYLRDTLRNVDRITTNSGPEMAKILANVRQITEDVRALTAAEHQGTPGGDLRETVSNLKEATKTLQEALNHTNSVAARIDRGEGTVGRLTKDETLINEVQGTVEGVNDFVGGLTRLQTIVGLRTDYNFLENTIKSYVSLRLQPREDKYYEIELINDPRGLTSLRAAERRHHQPHPARALPDAHDDHDQLVPVLAPVRAAPRPLHGALRHQGVDRRPRPRPAPAQGPVRARAGPVRLRRGGRPSLPGVRELRVRPQALAARPASTTPSRPTCATTSWGCSCASPTTTSRPSCRLPAGRCRARPGDEASLR